MTVSLERELQEQITQVFIADDPVSLDIFRPTPDISDGAGGHLPVAPVLVASQDFRLLPQSRNTSQVTNQTASGLRDMPRFVIMSTNDFTFERDDFYVWHGFQWDVLSVHDMPLYESKADVVRGKKV